jgi:hypothetical protein
VKHGERVCDAVTDAEPARGSRLVDGADDAASKHVLGIADSCGEVSDGNRWDADRREECQPRCSGGCQSSACVVEDHSTQFPGRGIGGELGDRGGDHHRCWDLRRRGATIDHEADS